MALTELQLLKTLVQKFQFDPLNAEFFLVRKGEGQSFVVMEALVKLAHSKVVSTSALFGGGPPRVLQGTVPVSVHAWRE